MMHAQADQDDNKMCGERQIQIETKGTTVSCLYSRQTAQEEDVTARMHI